MYALLWVINPCLSSSYNLLLLNALLHKPWAEGVNIVNVAMNSQINTLTNDVGIFGNAQEVIDSKGQIFSIIGAKLSLCKLVTMKTVGIAILGSRKMKNT